MKERTVLVKFGKEKARRYPIAQGEDMIDRLGYLYQTKGRFMHRTGDLTETTMYEHPATGESAIIKESFTFDEVKVLGIRAESLEEKGDSRFYK